MPRSLVGQRVTRVQSKGARCLPLRRTLDAARPGPGNVAIGECGDAVGGRRVRLVDLDQVLHPVLEDVQIEGHPLAQLQAAAELEAAGTLRTQVRIADDDIAERAVVEEEVTFLQVGHAVALAVARAQRPAPLRRVEQTCPQADFRYGVGTEVRVVLPAGAEQQFPAVVEQDVVLQEDLVARSPGAAAPP